MDTNLTTGSTEINHTCECETPCGDECSCETAEYGEACKGLPPGAEPLFNKAFMEQQEQVAALEKLLITPTKNLSSNDRSLKMDTLASGFIGMNDRINALQEAMDRMVKEIGYIIHILPKEFAQSNPRNIWEDRKEEELDFSRNFLETEEPSNLGFKVKYEFICPEMPDINCISTLILGNGQAFGEIEVALFNRKVGDGITNLSITYPNDFRDSRVAGKTLKFNLKVLSVKRNDTQKA